ncbi:MAG TPA: VWA domain-containing protein [Rhodanobacteraceae bacterium]
MSAFEFPLHFLRPWWWLALTPLPFAIWVLARNVGGRAALARLADAALLAHLVHDSGTRKHAALGLFALGWLLAVAAMAGPAWQKVPTPLYVNGAARVVALSLSNDMLAEDMQPNRLTRARFAVHDLLNAAGDARTALVAYAGAAFTVAPLTDDKRTVLNLLRALSPNVMPVPGNDAAAGIKQSVALLQQSHVKGGEIVLVTDSAGDAAVAAAKAAAAEGIRVDVLGIGTTQGAPVPKNGGGFANGSGGMLMARRDDSALDAVARAGGGRYAVLHADGSGVAALGAPVAESGHASHGERARLWRDGGVWLLPVLLVLAALAFRRGWLLAFVVLALPIGMPTAHAATFGPWFANRDQRALHALRDGDPAQAQKLATTSGIRGAAEYRAGDFASAAKAFAQGHDARSRYNLGNALAKEGKYSQAITAYQQALQSDPKMDDARANLEAVQDWLKQHPKQSPKSGNQSKQQNGKQGQPKSSASGSGSNPNQGNDKSGKQSNAQPSSSPDSKSGQPRSQGNSKTDKPSQRGSSSTNGMQQQRGESTSATPPSQQQAWQAEQGVARELQQAKRQGKPQNGNAFALGQSTSKQNDHLDAQQRAMLHAVPDDPGALLRRKFRLEWEHRNGQQQQDGQP